MLQKLFIFGTGRKLAILRERNKGLKKIANTENRKKRTQYKMIN